MDRNEQFLRRFLRHESDIRAFIGSLVPDRQVRDDLAQEVAMVLWRQFDLYDPARSFGAWARGIAANKVLQRRSQDARFPVVFSPETIRAVRDAFDRTEPNHSDVADALTECLQRLPEHARNLLALRYERGLQLSEIGRRLERSVDAVCQRLSRIRAALRDCIHDRLRSEAGSE